METQAQGRTLSIRLMTFIVTHGAERSSEDATRKGHFVWSHMTAAYTVHWEPSARTGPLTAEQSHGLRTRKRTAKPETVPWPPLSPRDAVTLFSKVWRKSFSATTLEPKEHIHLKTHRDLLSLNLCRLCKTAVLITGRIWEKRFKFLREEKEGEREKGWSTGGGK